MTPTSSSVIPLGRTVELPAIGGGAVCQEYSHPRFLFFR
jgi:hypothetical protein